MQPFFYKIISLSHECETWAGDYILWYRNPLEAIQSLFSNPLFKDEMIYTLEKHFSYGGKRVYLEIHWSDWWWRTQIFLKCIWIFQIISSQKLIYLWPSRILCQRELQLFLFFWVLTRPVSPSLEEKAAGHYILPLGTCPKVCDARTPIIHIYLWDIFLFWRQPEKRQINQLLQRRREFCTSDVCDTF